MGSVNSVTLIGRLGADPEIKFLDGGAELCSFSLATSETWKDKDGEKQEATQWHKVKVWGKSAPHCAQYLQKGSQCCVEGKVVYRPWEDKEGQARLTTEIKAGRVTFLSSAQERETGTGQRELVGKKKEPRRAPYNDEIPF
tara:strand:+ start:555 stop:977 length:423 start_codon:yes stop_codon:yes gene_type:complete